MLLIFDSCEGVALKSSPRAVPLRHIPLMQLLPPVIRCRASPRLIVIPVVRCTSSIIFAKAAFCSSVPWMNFRRIAGFCFLSRLVNSRLSRRLRGFVKSSIGGSLSLPVQLLTELREGAGAPLTSTAKSTARLGTIFHCVSRVKIGVPAPTAESYTPRMQTVSSPYWLNSARGSYSVRTCKSSRRTNGPPCALT